LGASFLALNRWRVGARRGAALALAMGAAQVALMVLLASVARGGTLLVAVPAAIALQRAAQADAPAMADHLAAGGRRASWWVSLAAPIAVVAAAIGGAVWLFGPLVDPSVSVGANHLHYGTGATETTAAAAADILREDGFFGELTPRWPRSPVTARRSS
jgi:hypothetical protein